MENVGVPFEWVAPNSQTGPIQADLETVGATLYFPNRRFEPPPTEREAYSQSGFDPLIVIAGVMGITLLAERVVAFVKDLKQDGLIIDVRGDPISIRPHPALDRGILLVVTADGAEQIDATRRTDLAALITSFRS